MTQMHRNQLADILRNEELYATTLVTMLVDEFGLDFFDWAPETLELEILSRAGIKLPDINRDKIWALVTAITTNTFYVSLETFIPVCNSLNGSEADFDDYDPVTSEEAAWGIAEVLLHDPAQKDEDVRERFSHEIRRYIGMTLNDEGLTTVPRTLKPYAEFDKDQSEPIGIDMGPDEYMIAAYTKRQTEARDEVDAYVQARLEALQGQLATLPLRNGSYTTAATASA